MSHIVKQNTSSFLSAGIHVVAVKKIEDVEDIQNPEKTKLMIELESVEEISGHRQTARFWASPILHPKGRMKPFVEAVLGRQLTVTEVKNGFDIDDLIEKQLSVVIRDCVTQNGKTFGKVTDFIALQNN